jgi:hypothetical protein
MHTRRQLLATGGLAVVIALLAENPAFAQAGRLLLIHGRSQQGRNPSDIKKEWLDALAEGSALLGKTMPSTAKIDLPYYGDRLDELSRSLDVPLVSEIRERGGPTQDEFLEFQAAVLEEVRTKAKITDAQVNAIYGNNPKQKGPQNWEWVQSIVSAIDKHGGGVSQFVLEEFLRDVFLYTARSGVRDEIDQIVREPLTEEPTIVIAHSLGSVVAYNVLRSDPRKLNVPLFVTVGCPLGIRAIRQQLRPLKFPKNVGRWDNAFDPRDVVALFPLDEENFPVRPSIENFAGVDNKTDNRHGISGYLNDRTTAQWILEAIAN